MMALTRALMPLAFGLAMLAGDPWVEETRADEMFSVAIGDQKMGGAIDYIRMPDGSLDGRFVYYRDAGKYNPETARPVTRGAGFVGNYNTKGSVSGKPYNAKLTINLLGRDPDTNIDYYRLAWDNGDTGLAIAVDDTALVGGFGVSLVGFVAEKAGEPTLLTLLGWTNGKPTKMQLTLDGKTIVGNHTATPKVGGGNPEAVRISRNGDSYRMEFRDGARGVMMNTERTTAAPVAKAPAVSGQVAKAEPGPALPSGNPPPTMMPRAPTTPEADLTPEMHFGCAIALAFLGEIAAKEPAKAKVYKGAAEYVIFLGLQRAAKAGTKTEDARKVLDGMTKVKADLYGKMPNLAAAEALACGLAGLWPKM